MSASSIPSEIVYFSIGRVWTIAVNTLTEMTRQKVFYFMIAFAMLMIGAASFFSIFSFGEEAEYITQLKFIKDTGLGAIGVFGSIIAIVATAQLLPAELENRTIYTILAKPVHRLEFLLGKFAGAALLLIISVFLMGLLFLGVVYLKDQNLARTTYHETVALTREAVASDPSLTLQVKREAIAHAEKNAAQAVTEIHKTAGYHDIVKALLTVLCKLLLIAAMTLFLSTFATSMVFTVLMSAMLYFCGHLVPVAQRFYGGGGTLMDLMKQFWRILVQVVTGHLGLALRDTFSVVVNWVIPNLAAFDVADDLFAGLELPWLKVLKIVCYGAFYLLVTLTLAHLIFREREI